MSNKKTTITGAGEAVSSETACWAVCRYDEKYEVNSASGPWKPGQEKRKGPLIFVRLLANAEKWSLSYRNLVKEAGDDLAPCLGVFIMALEFASALPAELRGYLVWEKDGNPITIPEFAEATGISEVHVTLAFQVLSCQKVAWMKKIDGFAPSPRIPGIPRPFKKSSQVKSSKVNQCKASGLSFSTKEGLKSISTSALEKLQARYPRVDVHKKLIEVRDFLEGQPRKALPDDNKSLSRYLCKSLHTALQDKPVPDAPTELNLCKAVLDKNSDLDNNDIGDCITGLLARHQAKFPGVTEDARRREFAAALEAVDSVDLDDIEDDLILVLELARGGE